VDELVSARDMERLHPEAVAAALGMVLKRNSRGSAQALASVLGVRQATVKARLAACPPGRLWEAAEEARNAAPKQARDLAAAGTPEALARTAQIGDGWLEAARTKVMAEAAAGQWHAARVRLPGVDHWTAVAVRGADRAAAEARVAALWGEGATAEWVEATPPEPARDEEAEVAAAVLQAGIVVRDPDHALAVYPGLFKSRSGAVRGMAPVLSRVLMGAGIGSETAVRGGAAYMDLYKRNRPEPLVWNHFRFRAGAAKRGRLAGAWVAEGREEEARAVLQAALGKLSVWRRDEVPEPPLRALELSRHGAHREHPPSAEAEPDAAEPTTGLDAAVVESVEADLPFAAVDPPPPRLVRLVAMRAAWRPVCVEMFAVPPDPEEDASKIAARATISSWPPPGVGPQVALRLPAVAPVPS
jgi:hypothetical protein